MYNVYRDHPIKDATHFNFDIYATSLAKIILNKENKTPFTIAINGKWGCGKTTLMRTLRNELDSSKPDNKTRKVKTVWFDAWKYSECDSMLAALVNEILEEMQRKNLLDNLKAKILVGAEKVDVLKEMSDLAKVLTHGTGPEFEKWFRKTQYQNKLSFFDLFQDYMETILQIFVLEKDGGRYIDSRGVLVIFIDDLDRCSPKNIANILESINLFLDLEGCFFIIGTDVSIISNAIEYQYQGVKDFSGIDYIKKMIQLNFDLPKLKEDDIQAFMKKELKIDSKLEPYFDIILKGLKSNQREIIRFLNSLSLMRILGGSLHGIGYEEELLIKWSVLNFSSVDFIDEVKRKPNLLIKTQEISIIGTIIEREKYIDTLEDKRLREKCTYFSEDDKIISVLSRGSKKFTLESIDTYLSLSNIVPKDVNIEKSLQEIKAELIPGGDLKNADLSGIFIEKAELMSIDLTEADLTGADIQEANLLGAKLIKTNLKEANLSKANLSRAKLMGAHLTDASLIKAKLVEANLTGANLNEADLTDAFLDGAILRGARLIGTNIQEARLVEANLRDAKLMGANLKKTNLEGADLRGANLTGANLEGANFHSAIFNGNALGSVLRSVEWEKAIFDDHIMKNLTEFLQRKS